MYSTITRESGSAATGINEAGGAKHRHRRYAPAQMHRMQEAAVLAGRAFDGDWRANAELREALATSDFQAVFGAVLDRELLAAYESLPSVWAGYARRVIVNDFKSKSFYDLLGGNGVLDVVPELAEYPERQVDTGSYSLSVKKYGGTIGLSWEANINDDLGMFRDLPARLAQGAVDTEDYVATQILAIATGYNTTFFSSGNGNLLAGNPALTNDSLQAALTAISSRRDTTTNRPIVVTSAVLVVPPALEIAANNIVGAEKITLKTSSQEVTVQNPLRNRVAVVMNPWLPVIDVSANVNTTWYLLPAPNNPRPAAAVGFLRGHETPDLRVKSDTGSRVGGGSVAPEEGSFETDDIRYRVRHVMGSATLDPKTTAVSNGSGA